MKRTLSLLLSTLLCLALISGCTQNTPAGNENTASSPTGSDQPILPDSPDVPPADTAEPSPIFLDTLTFELAVSWEDGQRLLPALQDMALLLQDALAAQSCQVDEITITISTAGGLTGDALETGGVDLALLAAEDFAACSNTVAAVLTDSEVPCSIVLAASGARTELSEDFRQALTRALLETEPGQTFLHTYQNGICCIPAAEETIQAIRSQADSST